MPAARPAWRASHNDLVPTVELGVRPVLVLATEPLPHDTRERLRLNHRAAVNDMRHLRSYARGDR